MLWCWYGFRYDYDWFQLWFLMWVIIVIWSQPTGTISKILSQPDQNRIKIMSKAQKPWRNRPKGWPGAVSVSFLGFTLPEPWKRRSVPKACQNHFKITSKSKHIPKPYPNHKPTYIKNIRTISKSWPKFKAYQIHIFFKTILKSLKTYFLNLAPLQCVQNFWCSWPSSLPIEPIQWQTKKIFLHLHQFF